ncbi:uncharacterized protein IL334_002916 [Kwoniella shivajii]|uniref:Aminoglycoside phosphotransferase domain-containing protein n=1 Tax=Kwoniella shivajii TaxID=564305 RepID=A0ABZ1CW23_9TREE|nr:hypothetical protein IL334_002916 [Kwoniella shivajii]
MPELIEYTCSVAGCDNTRISYEANCTWCHKVWCLNHVNDDAHQCAVVERTLPSNLRYPEWKLIRDDANRIELTKLLAQVIEHQSHIINDAISLRPGHLCTMDIPVDYEALKESKWFAYYNLHFLILFDDKVKWLLRVRQTRGQRLPKEITETVIKSEVATVNLLKGYGIPVPGAYLPAHMDASKAKENDTTLDYFFYEYMTGSPVQLFTKGFCVEDIPPEATMRHLIEEYAGMQIQLSNIRVPYKALGCIYPTDSGETQVGPIVSRGCFMNPKPPYFMGPFSSLRELTLAHIEAALRYIKLNALQGRHPLDEYLWHLEMRELVAASKELAEESEELFIKHVDKKGDEMMVDGNGTIVGILDWEWAYVTTKRDALSTPWIFNRTFAYIKAGSNELTEAEKFLITCYEHHHRPDLANCVRGGRLYLRLERIGFYDPVYRKSGFRQVFGKDIPADFDPPSEDVDWRVYMIKRYQNDIGLREVMERFEWTLEKAEMEASRWVRKEEKKG